MNRGMVSVALFALVLSGCFGTQPSDVLAKIGDIQITVKDFKNRIKEYEFDPSLMPQEESDEFKQRVLNEIIEERVLLQEAENEKIDASKEDLDRAMDEIRGDYKGDDFEKVLEEKGITLRELRERTRRNLVLRKIVEVATKNIPKPSKDRIEAHYKQNIERYFEQAKYDVRQIVTAKQEDAGKVIEQLKKGKSFEELAKAYSFSADGMHGGDLGWISGGLPEGVWEHVEKAPIQKPVGPIASEYGFHVLWIRGKKPQRLIPLAEATPTIVDEITAQEREDALLKWKQQVFSKVKVVRNNALLASI